MLTLIGFLMVITFMYLVMSKKLSSFCALSIIPIIYAIIGGFTFQIGPMMLKGIKDVSVTAIMMLFAIVFFGIMVDAGLFDLLIVKILKLVKGDPLKIVVGTAVLATFASLEGEGAVTIMITCTAMVPLYRRLNINPTILGTIICMTSSVKSLFPWAGPTARALSSLNLEVSDIFIPLLPLVVAGYSWIILAAYWMGKKERDKLGVTDIEPSMIEKLAQEFVGKNPELKRPKLFWINLILTLGIMGLLMVPKGLPVAVTFILGTDLAIIINYRDVKTQQASIGFHAKSALSVVSVVFAAGIFMGILTGTKMTDAMAQTMISCIPPGLGSHMAMITAILSAPLAFLLSNDAFYFGILPVLNNMAATYGVSAAEIGRASLMGIPIHMMSPILPALWLLLGLCDIGVGELIKKGVGWNVGLMIVYIVTAVVTGALSI